MNAPDSINFDVYNNLSCATVLHTY